MTGDKDMRRFILMISAALLAFSCTDHLEITFDDYYVCVKSENGMETSSVSADLNDYVVTYYVGLVSAERKEDLTVELEVVPGDGLKEGVDYEVVSSKTVKFVKGIYTRPFRIKYLGHALDSSKDNSLTIRILSTSDPDIIIGYPGPSAKFSSHTVRKQ